jgi:KaiC/GvpD/RAD55 family RecA-like ATPase/Flp pilus assembly protein TadD
MPPTVPCPTCASLNKPDAMNCRVCGRKLRTSPVGGPSPPVVLQREMGGEVFTAVMGEVPKKSPSAGSTQARAGAEPIVPPTEGEIEDHSDVIAAAVDRIRAKAQADGHRFKPYVPASGRKPSTPQAKQEAAKNLQTAVGLFRESKFDDAIEPLLKGISRDDEDRRSWILLAEVYLRLNRPYKAAVGFLRALELSPTDDQGWLGLGRVLRTIDDLPTAAAVLERATVIHPRSVDTWVERGLILEALQNLDEAARSFANVLELRPDHRIALEKREELVSRLEEASVEATSPEAAPTTTAATPSPAEADLEGDILDEMQAAFSLEASAEAAREGAAGPAPKSVPRRRVRTFVEGLDETLEGGIPRGHVVLIEGAPGTMKSSLGFSIAVQNAAHAGLHCLYLSLEERASSLLRQMGSLGLRLEVPKGSLVVLDPRTAKNLFGDKMDWLTGLRDGIQTLKEQRGLDLLVLDSLEALEVLAKFKDRRREIYRLFEWLRDLDITSFVVTERPDWVVAGHVLQGRWDEDFLADGIVHLRMHFVTDLTAQRRLRVVKMRGTKHDTGYLAMDLDEGRFRVTRAMSS